jgi:hypothetical protein
MGNPFIMMRAETCFLCDSYQWNDSYMEVILDKPICDHCISHIGDGDDALKLKIEEKLLIEL